MALVVPDDQEVEVLINRLTPPLTIKIYGNDSLLINRTRQIL